MTERSHQNDYDDAHKKFQSLKEEIDTVEPAKSRITIEDIDAIVATKKMEKTQVIKNLSKVQQTMIELRNRFEAMSTPPPEIQDAYITICINLSQYIKDIQQIQDSQNINNTGGINSISEPGKDITSIPGSATDNKNNISGNQTKNDKTGENTMPIGQDGIVVSAGVNSDNTQRQEKASFNFQNTGHRGNTFAFNANASQTITQSSNLGTSNNLPTTGGNLPTTGAGVDIGTSSTGSIGNDVADIGSPSPNGKAYSLEAGLSIDTGHNIKKRREAGRRDNRVKAEVAVHKAEQDSIVQAKNAELAGKKAENISKLEMDVIEANIALEGFEKEHNLIGTKEEKMKKLIESANTLDAKTEHQSHDSKSAKQGTNKNNKTKQESAGEQLKKEYATLRSNFESLNAQLQTLQQTSEDGVKKP